MIAKSNNVDQIRGNIMKVRRTSFLLALIWTGFLLTSGFGAAEVSGRRVEIGLWGGYSPVRTLGRMTVEESWSSFLLSSVAERTKIRSRAKDAPAAGMILSFFTLPHLGLEILAGYREASLETRSAFDFSYAWSDGGSEARSRSWNGTGRLIQAPGCLNLVWRQEAGRLSIELSGGPTVFWNRLRQESTLGYGVTRVAIDTTFPGGTLRQAVDALPVSLTVSKHSWWAFGADLGGSLNIRLGRAVALRTEARYFYCPPKRIAWKPGTGIYDGIFGGGIAGEPFTEDDIAYLTGAGQTLEQKTSPSFFQLSVGMMFFLGRAFPE